MAVHGLRGDGDGGSFEILADLTDRLASTPCLDRIATAVLEQIGTLGFGMVWMARFDESTGDLLTIKELIEGRDATQGSPEVMLDVRRPIGRGFHQRRMINIQDPESLFILDDESEPVPPGMLALPRGMYRHLRGSPFVTGPLLGSTGEPVGAIGLSAYRGRQAIPDDLLQRGLLRALIHHLGIAAERALQVSRLERVGADLARAQEAMVRDARLKTVGELASGVAHDLNNLCGIALMAVSSGRRSPSATGDALRAIERANRAIGEMVGRLQRVARIGAAAASRVIDIAEPVEIVQDILLMMTPMLREHSIQVELDASPVPAVRADPSVLHQVVLNLIINARDALDEVPAARRALRVQVREEEACVRIVVADSGPGIAPAALLRLFRPFTTTKGAGHLGIGLAAARVALERSGGQLNGRNAPTGGAVFEVKLERARRPERAPSERRPLGTGQTRAMPGPPRILVVDDDPDLVKVVGAFLEPAGYEIGIATSAARALAMAGEQEFDLVLCDLTLPGRTGLEIARELRETGFAGKVVIMTGCDDAIGCERGLYDHLLKKPFYGDDLLDVIETALRA
jgi:signal transduction histidine kinase